MYGGSTTRVGLYRGLVPEEFIDILKESIIILLINRVRE